MSLKTCFTTKSVEMLPLDGVGRPTGPAADRPVRVIPFRPRAGHHGLVRGWWLATQPRPVRVYVPVAVALSVLAAVWLASTADWSLVALGRALGWSALAALTSLVLRRRVLGVPVEQAAQDVVGVWGVAALLIWGPAEALLVSVLAVGLWTELARRRWERYSKPWAKVAVDVGGELMAITCASVVLGNGTGWIANMSAALTYVVVNGVVVLTAVCLAVHMSPRAFLASWTTSVMIFTEVLVSVGMAAAWRTSPVAAVGLAWAVVSANAGMHYMRLHELASTDARTGLMTAQTWHAAVSRILTRTPVAVLMGDLDHFKALNDDQGHLTGDHVLAIVGRVISENLRVGDFACRWGGEEFVLALPGMAITEAGQVAERLRSGIAASSGVAASVTISIGVSSAPSVPMDDAGGVLTAAVEEADAAMYLAKAQGRDRVVLGRPAQIDGGIVRTARG
jgi:diguanylate cyclase (GGDEF)-like protein